MNQKQGIELYWKQTFKIPLLTKEEEYELTTSMQEFKKAFQKEAYRIGLKFYIDLVSKHPNSTLFISPTDSAETSARIHRNLENIIEIYNTLKEDYPPKNKTQKQEMQKRLKNAGALLQELPIYPSALLEKFDFLEAISKHYAKIKRCRIYISKHKNDGQEKRQELEGLCTDILLGVYEFKPTIRRYQKAYESYETLKTRLINANLRLCCKPVKSNLNKGIDESDLVQEGNKGLIRAAYLFNPHLGNRFSTYALTWIRQSISNAVQSNKEIIRQPIYLSERFQRIIIAEDDFIAKFGREPTDWELLSHANLINKTEVKKKHISDYRKRRKIFSLDNINQAGYSLYDTTGNNNSPNPLEQTRIQEIRKKVNQILKQLSTKEKEILEKRYGLNDYPVMTLKEIGKEAGLTKERIRQIEERAKKKFRLISSKIFA